MTGHLRELTRSEIEALCDRQSVICREYAAEIARLRAALDAMTADRDFANAQLADGAFYKESDIDVLEGRAQKAEGDLDAARVKALDDACQKLADVLAFGYRENVIVREAFSQAAKEISAMKEPKG